MPSMWRSISLPAADTPEHRAATPHDAATNRVDRHAWSPGGGARHIGGGPHHVLPEAMPALERVLELHHPPTRLLQCLARLEQLELRAPERLVNESGHRNRIAEPAEPTTFGRRGDTRR